jgi:hypoxanthine-DNA glycosylase
MELSQGFPPVAGQDAQTLILGSMPGVASLEARQYYAFGRNAFWQIMGELFGAGPQLEYRQRLDMLVNNRIALWDVIAACHRPGSLDSAIRESDLVINDFSGFLETHRNIERICFNGQKAASLFRQKVLPSLKGHYQFITLPSTSPAHAARNYIQKLEAWSVIGK